MTASGALVTAMLFLPLLGAAVIACLPGNRRGWIGGTGLIVTGTTAALAWGMFLLPGLPTAFEPLVGTVQHTVRLPWIPSFGVEYFVGIDGISLPLVLLTTGITFLAWIASREIETALKTYAILFLFLETGMIGVFLALDFFLFYVFWEVMLVPMYFLIGIWGGSRRLPAAIKFFLFTVAGSVLVLLAGLLLYFHGDVRTLAEARFDRAEATIAAWDSLHLGPETARRAGVHRLTAPDGSVLYLLVKRSSETAGHDLMIRLVAEPTGPEDTRPDEPRTSEDANPAEADRPVTPEADPSHGPMAGYDASSHQVLIGVDSAEETSAAVIVEAIHANPLLAPVVSALAERRPGSRTDASGAISARDAAARQTGRPDGTIEAEQDPIRRIDSESWQAGVSLTGADRAPVRTFNLIAWAAMATETTLFPRDVQWWGFVLLFLGFAVKLPAVPIHSWLPEAHTEAPTAISMLLAGVLLKTGGYGLIRLAYPLCPYGGHELAPWVCALGVVGMIYGALGALAQTDFKRLVAYSSISHMGYVLLGLGAWSVTRDATIVGDSWLMGVQGALFQMIAHGITGAGLFFLVGVISHRVQTRDLTQLGGLYSRMPMYTALGTILLLGSMGLPALCGFWGEIFVLLAAWRYSPALASVGAVTIVLTAGYILWTLQRVYLGSEYTGPFRERLAHLTFWERAILIPLAVMTIALGVAPHQTVFRYTSATVERQVGELAAWTRSTRLLLPTERRATPAGPRPQAARNE